MRARKMVPRCGAEWSWKRLGLGVEVSVGYWVPREWSIHIHVLGLLMWAGMEEDLYAD